PFALRRAAQGIVKMLFEARLRLDLMRLAEGVPGLGPFLTERIESYLRETVDYDFDEVNAVIAAGITTLADLADRAEAVHVIRRTPDFEPLAASFKRIKNILRQAQVAEANPPQASLLSPGPEEDLYQAFLRVREETQASGTYADKLASI